MYHQVLIVVGGPPVWPPFDMEQEAGIELAYERVRTTNLWQYDTHATYI